MIILTLLNIITIISVIILMILLQVWLKTRYKSFIIGCKMSQLWALNVKSRSRLILLPKQSWQSEMVRKHFFSYCFKEMKIRLWNVSWWTLSQVTRFVSSNMSSSKTSHDERCLQTGDGNLMKGKYTEIMNNTINASLWAYHRCDMPWDRATIHNTPRINTSQIE